MTNEEFVSSNFIHNIIDKDIAQKTYGEKPIYTRFPPEPNGYLHIGHAKSICLNFSTAQKYGGKCNLRFDDTNPIKEDTEYVDSIKSDVKWLGFNWDELLFASDYFDKMYEFAVLLIKKDKAFVCDLSPEDIKNYRGTLKEPGKCSPFRERTIEENLDLFERMKQGEFKDGEKVLRAKIDMNSPNINMRDPVIYRIAHAKHHNTGNKWCIYPMYDYAHPIEDALENITHSICTLEFEDHRPLYDWVLREIGFEAPPQQIEFARLNLTNTVMSKRYLKALVDDKNVEGWDDPRMPTIAGLRRRGYTPEAIRDFCERIGVAKSNSTVDISLLEHCIREDLQNKTEMRMVILKPLKVTITNYPADKTETLLIENSKEQSKEQSEIKVSEGLRGMREVSFSNELYIERDDFMEFPEKKYFRLFPGNEVRFKGAYFITCQEVVKDALGEVIELKCSYDPTTKSGSGFDGRKVKGTIHWVDAKTAVKIKVRTYDHLMTEDDKGENQLNPNSMNVYEAYAESAVADVSPGERYQFFRHGYFIADTQLTVGGDKVFNRIVDLKSSYSRNR